MFINLTNIILSHLARPPSYPNLSSACDEGYSTSSQNGWPLPYGTHSISSPPSESFDDAYDTSSKSGTITKKEQEDLRHLLKTFEDTTSSGESDHDDALDREINVGRVEIQSMNVTCTQTDLPQSAVLIPGKISVFIHQGIQGIRALHHCVYIVSTNMKFDEASRIHKKVRIWLFNLASQLLWFYL